MSSSPIPVSGAGVFFFFFFFFLGSVFGENNGGGGLEGDGGGGIFRKDPQGPYRFKNYIQLKFEILYKQLGLKLPLGPRQKDKK